MPFAIRRERREAHLSHVVTATRTRPTLSSPHDIKIRGQRFALRRAVRWAQDGCQCGADRATEALDTALSRKSGGCLALGAGAAIPFAGLIG